MFSNILVTFALVATVFAPPGADVAEPGAPCNGYVGINITGSLVVQPVPHPTLPWCPPVEGQPTWPYSGTNGGDNHPSGLPCLPTFQGAQPHNLDALLHSGWCWPDAIVEPTIPPTVPSTDAPTVPYVPGTTAPAVEETTAPAEETTAPEVEETTAPAEEATTAPEATTPGNRLPQTGIVAANVGLAGAALAGIGAYLKKKQ